ncbi:hypothetical protein AB0465_14785 [Streptomyces griseoviridis]|uniref:hypothetical protein n=1 Tax=Streptomyces griseoviridis TaxID=45398 RepID=UPI00340FDF76
MSVSRFVKHTVPVALCGALATITLATTPASAASSGYVYSSGPGGEGWYYYGNGWIYANDIKADGFASVTQVFADDGRRLLVSVQDSGANNGISWKTPVLFEGFHKVRACVYKTGHAPTKCGAMTRWYVD